VVEKVGVLRLDDLLSLAAVSALAAMSERPELFGRAMPSITMPAAV
jgi:hypothetical protein